MKLYHGTSEALKEQILLQGIQPRGKKRGNWKQAPSRNDAVYLTDSYAPYFAVAAAAKNVGGLVIEIDTDRLEQFRLAPDEDVMEQIGRGRDNVKDDMLERTAWYRKRLENWAGADQWKTSIKAMGTAAYLRAIDVNAITRMVTIPPDSLARVGWQWDASISLMNYRFCGEKYKLQTARLFGDDPETDDDDWKIEIPPVILETFKDGKVISTSEITAPDQRERMHAMMKAAGATTNTGAST